MWLHKSFHKCLQKLVQITADYSAIGLSVWYNVKNNDICFATELKNFSLAQRRALVVQLFELLHKTRYSVCCTFQMLPLRCTSILMSGNRRTALSHTSTFSTHRWQHIFSGKVLHPVASAKSSRRAGESLKSRYKQVKNRSIFQPVSWTPSRGE